MPIPMYGYQTSRVAMSVLFPFMLKKTHNIKDATIANCGCNCFMSSCYRVTERTCCLLCISLEKLMIRACRMSWRQCSGLKINWELHTNWSLIWNRGWLLKDAIVYSRRPRGSLHPVALDLSIFDPTHPWGEECYLGSCIDLIEHFFEKSISNNYSCFPLEFSPETIVMVSWT